MVQDRSFGVGECHESSPSEKKLNVIVQRNGISFFGVRFMYLGPLAFPVPQTGVFFLNYRRSKQRSEGLRGVGRNYSAGASA